MENVKENAMYGAFANLSSSVAEHKIQQLSRPRKNKSLDDFVVPQIEREEEL